jgi:hypothetical protein
MDIADRLAGCGIWDDDFRAGVMMGFNSRWLQLFGEKSQIQLMFAISNGLLAAYDIP